MKKLYSKPVLTVESFVTDEIMDNNDAIYNETNILSYNPAADVGGYGTNGQQGFISFRNDPENMLNSIEYSQFNPQN